MTERAVAARIAGAFLASAAGGVGFVVAYAADASPQVQGLLLAAAFGGLGFGVIAWVKHLMAVTTEVEERSALEPHTADEAATAAQFRTGAQQVHRRRLLGRLLALAVGALGVAVVAPLRSLGPSPLPELRRTPWQRGSRLVTEDGSLVRAETLDVGGALTVFPEGHQDAPEAQVVLVRVTPGLVRPAPGREEWAPQGYLAYSKICTHAGCPVGLYQQDSHRLLCPCHQSAFDVLDGAKPTFGPATRPLPQLPLALDADGYLIAQSDFTDPVGPGFWSLP